MEPYAPHLRNTLCQIGRIGGPYGSARAHSGGWAGAAGASILGDLAGARRDSPCDASRPGGRWQVRPALLAGAGTLVLVVLWRLIANALGVNDDSLPAVSVGDAGCLIADGVPPAVAAVMNRRLPRRAIPAIAGALAAFVINVVIL